MATVYKYEDKAGDALYTNGIRYLSATTTNRVLFNDPSKALTTTAYTTAIYYPTEGSHEGSGTGKIVFDNAYDKSVVYIIDNDDRRSWGTILLSATNSIVSNPLISITGITVTSSTSGAGYTSVPTVTINTKGAGVITPLVATALMHSTGAGVTGVTVSTKGVYVPGTEVPTITFTGGGYTTQATGTVTLSSGSTYSQSILSLSANGNNAWGPTERRLRLLEYI